MELELYQYFDVVIVLMLVVSILVGLRKGAVRAVLAIVFSFVSLLAANLFVTADMAEKYYDEKWRPFITKHVDEALDNFKEEARKRLEQAVKDGIKKAVDDFLDPDETEEEDKSPLPSPEESIEKLKKIVDELSDTTRDSVNARLPFFAYISKSTMKEIAADTNILNIIIDDALGRSNTTITEYVERTYIRPRMIHLIENIMRALVFCVVKLVSAVVMSIVYAILRRSKPAQDIDKLAGGILGLASGVVLCAIFTFAMIKVVHSMDDRSYAEEYIHRTYIFKYAYDVCDDIGNKAEQKG